ncbi:MAG: ATP-binding cassette domain-containing protein [Candidatus Actinomarinales bacterium]|nr:MAG: ATP-binding cassette domain-containing protein [Candidatus Actinomarinales bacterium]|tara:strand:- start:175 stop:867 length:693 start_codon:yes stop_codon:yes gene_type:complete
MIKFKDISLVFAGGSVALSNISTNISDGEFVYLIGPSGSGKSSFLKIIYKDLIPTNGSIEVTGLDVNDLARWRIPLLRRKLGIVLQEPKLLKDRTVSENIGFAMEVLGFTPGEIKIQVSQLLSLVEIEHEAYKYPEQLSSGQQTRVAIARALASKPLVLLCDEPTGNLDPALSSKIVVLLEKINRAGTTIIMATHDSSIVNRRKKRIIELNAGKVIRDEDRGRYNISGNN